jgi:hypothetical protein
VSTSSIDVTGSNTRLLRHEREVGLELVEHRGLSGQVLSLR